MSIDPAERAARIERRKQAKSQTDAAGIGCGILIILGFLFALHQCTKTEPPSEDELAALAAKEAENRENGFHCLSGWDGSNRSMVRQVEAGLRDPDSFEHVDTTITPVNPKTGKHGVRMTFRAKNGFGGVNVGRAIAEVDPNTCEAANVIVDG